MSQSFDAARRFDRARVMRRAQLRLRSPRARTLSCVEIRTLTCEGAGLIVPRTRRPLLRGAAVEMYFQVAGRPLCVPGAVAWHQPGEPKPGTVNAGLRFFVEAASPETSRIYADWIVSLLIGPAPTDPPQALFAWRERILQVYPWP